MDRKNNAEKLDEVTGDTDLQNASHKKPAMVTEVVEDIELESVPDKTEAANDTGTVQEEEIRKPDNYYSSSGVNSDTEKKTLSGDRKQVVEELFTKKGNDDLMEIKLKSSDSSRKLISWAIIVIVAALVTGIGLILFSTQKPETVKEKTSPRTTESSPTAAPTPTVVAVKLDRADITVQVLNGGGTPGAASKMKSVLTDLGYDVQNVGNTDEYTYDKTEIEVKKDKEAAASMLKSDLADDYTIGSATATLSDTSDYDAVVIVGKE